MNKNLSKISFIIIAIFALISSNLYAQTYTSVQDGNWNETTTWDLGDIPTGGDIVVINHAVILSVDVGGGNGLASLTVKSNGSLKGNFGISIGGPLDCSGTIDLSPDGDLSFKNNAGVTVNGQIIADEISVSGSTVTVSGVGVVIANLAPAAFASLEVSNLWTGGTDSDWNTTANWYSATLPGSADDVSISLEASNFPVISGSAGTINSFKIQDGTSVTISIDGDLTISNDLINDGTLTIQSDATGTGSLIVGSTSGTGTATVQRYIPSDQWHIVSSPVAGQPIGSFITTHSLEDWTVEEGGDGTYDFAPYNESGDVWGPFDDGTSTDPFEQGKGYMIRLDETNEVTPVVFSGTGIHSGTIQKNIEKTTNGWNSLGNPYTSPIRANASTNSFLSVNNASIDQTYGGIFVWNQSLPDYETISQVTDADTEIAVGQGFVVKSPTGGKQVSFTPDMQLHTSTDNFKSAELPWPSLTLNVSVNSMQNNALVAFGQGMTNSLDPMYDVGKLKGNPDLALYTKLLEGSENVDFAVQALPDLSYDELRIPVGLDLPNGGEVTFTLDVSTTFRSDAEVYLEDTQNQTLTLLSSGDAEYTTTVAEGAAGAGRFNIVLSKYTATGAEKPVAENDFTVFTRDRLIFVNGPANENTALGLYSIDGKQWVSRRALNRNQNTIDASGFPAGVYLLKIVHNGTPQTEKLVITQ